MSGKYVVHVNERMPQNHGQITDLGKPECNMINHVFSCIVRGV